MLRKTAFLFILILVSFLFTPIHTFASTTYTLKDLGLPANLNTSYAESINSKDQIVGYTNQDGDTANKAFLYKNGAYSYLPVLPGGTYAQAFDINDSEQAVGLSNGIINGTNQSAAVMWDKGKVEYLGDLGIGGQARAINNKGQIVGFAYNPTVSNPNGFAFIWERGEITPLPTLGGINNFAYDINDQGVIVGAVETPQGYEAVYWKDGVLHDLGIKGFAYGINNKNQIVGSMRIPSVTDYRAFLWDNGTVTDLGTLENIRSEAHKINERGQIVGISNYATGIQNQSTYHAVIWQNGSITDLRTLNGSSFAKSINNKGSITGFAETSTSIYHPILWY